VLGLGTLMLFWRAGGHGFILLDDAGYVRLNLNVVRGLSWEGVKWAFTTGEMSNWHPLTWLSHMLDCSLFGLNPGAHHLVSAAIHALNSVLLFQLGVRLTGATWRSAFVAALFAWHPLHVESVAWISERKDVLSGLFFMLTLLAYVGYLRKPSLWRYGLTALLLALGLMAKPMLVTLPFVMLLLDWWPLNRWRGGPTESCPSELTRPSVSCSPSDGERVGVRGPATAPTPERVQPETPRNSVARLILEKLPFFALVAAASVVTILVQRHGKAMVSTNVFSFGDRLGNALVSYVEYLAKLVWPTNLAVFYPHPGARAGWLVTLAAVVLLLSSIGVAANVRRRGYLLTGWLWFLGMLLPVIGLVQVGDQALADRYTYLPFIGVGFMLAWGAAEAAAKWPQVAPGIAALGWVLPAAWMIGTSMQLRHWQNNETLFTHARAVTRKNYVADTIVGNMLRSRGQLEEARACLANALRARPTYGQALAGMGDLHAAQRQFDDAIRFYAEALRLEPHLSDAQNAWGGALLAQGKPQDAVEHFTAATRLDPTLAEAEFNLGLAFRQLRRAGEAAAAFRRALNVQPQNLPARLLLADCLAETGAPREALALLQPVAKARSDAVDALRRIAWILATCPDNGVRNGGEAVTFAVRACDLTAHHHAASLAALAAAYAEVRRFDDAIAMARKAEELATRAGEKELLDVIRRTLAAFEARTAYREIAPAPAPESPR
jgi:tetratricopeptide (TPR) repeat protein